MLHVSRSPRQAVIRKSGERAGYAAEDRSTFLWLQVKGYDPEIGCAGACECIAHCSDRESGQFQVWLASGELTEIPCSVPGGQSYVLLAGGR